MRQIWRTGERTTACAALLLALAACGDRAPSGQVLASVGGDDITKRDLAFEAAVTGLPIGAATLAAIVDRKVLAQHARDESLDRTPEYLSALRRFREATLAAMVARQLALDAPRPDDAALARYVAAHRWQFADRARVEVRQADGTTRAIDTATLPDDAARLASAAPGDSLTIAGQRVTVLAHTPVAMTPQQRIDAARTALARERGPAAVQAFLAGAKAAVRIRYQPGTGLTSK